jgi:hypothetical protein
MEYQMGKQNQPSDETSLETPREPVSVFARRRNHGPCLPPPSGYKTPEEIEDEQSPVGRMSDEYRRLVDAGEECEGSGEATIVRLSEGFRSLSTEEQMQAKILAAKRKPSASADGEGQADVQPEDTDYVAAEQPAGEVST